MRIMTAQIQFTIKPELLASLGKISGLALSPVSPFRFGKETDTAGGIAQLAALGVCDAKGSISPEKKDAVSSLALAEAFTRIYLTTPQRVIEYIAYFAPDGKIVGVTNDGGMQLVTFPAPNDAMLELIRQTIGFSVYSSIPFTTQLNRAETLIFSAMIDLERKEMMRKFADDKTAERIAVSSKDVLEMLKIPPGNIRWFSSAFVDLFSAAQVPKPEETASVFESLTAKGLVTRSGKKYALSDSGVILARNHLLPSMYLTLTTGKGQQSGKTNIAGFSCIISGIHDLLYIDYNADEVEIEAVASAEILEYAKTFLTDRSVLAKMDTAAPPSAPAGGNERRFCPQCGALLKPGIKFCNTCGTKIG
jgi:hypothetical protein